MNELKPCPFCGGEADEDSYLTNKHMVYGTGWIGCRSCRAFIEYMNGDRGKSLAVEAWNRRVVQKDKVSLFKYCPNCGAYMGELKND